MNSKRLAFLTFIPIVSLLISSCGPGQIFGPTFTPTPSLTLTPTLTPTPTITATPTITPTPTITRTPIPGTIEVRARDSSGKPIAGLLVVALGIPNVTLSQKLYTDAEGRFVFKDVPPDVYMIGCGKEGSEITLEVVVLLEGGLEIFTCMPQP